MRGSREPLLLAPTISEKLKDNEAWVMGLGAREVVSLYFPLVALEGCCQCPKQPDEHTCRSLQRGIATLGGRVGLWTPLGVELPQPPACLPTQPPTGWLAVFIWLCFFQKKS